MLTTLQISRIHQVSVAEQHRILRLIRRDARREYRHHIRSILIKRDSSETFRLALRAKVPRRLIKSLERGVLLRLNRRRHSQIKRLRRQRAQRDPLPRPFVRREFRAVHLDRRQLHRFIAVQEQRFPIRIVRRSNSNRRRHRRRRLPELKVQIHPFERVRRSLVILQIYRLRRLRRRLRRRRHRARLHRARSRRRVRWFRS